MATRYSPSPADPSGPGTLVAAVGWLQGTMLGTVATTVAVIAVASVGMLMLNGRIDWRRGVTVVVGCFVLFGATSIVAGIEGIAGSGFEPPAFPAYTAPPPGTRPSPQTPAVPHDPYMGASVRP